MGLGLLVLAGCTTPPVQRVALLAPFEGRHREIGYQALYAARLAIAEAEQPHLELLAIDDGGTLATAQDRARALNRDPQVVAVLLLGPYPTDAATVEILRGDLDKITIGDWRDSLDPLSTASAPTTCGDLCQLTVFAATTENPTTITVQSNAPPVTDEFAARYSDFDIFAPAPLPLARLTYEMTAAWLRGESYTPSRHTYMLSADGLLVYQP